MARLVDRIWRNVFSRRGPWRIGESFDAADNIPKELPKKTAVLVGSIERPKWIAFDCPCNTGHRIMLNLDTSRRPAWRIAAVNPLSLRPSVDALNGRRRCHFVLSNGQVTWIPSHRRWRKEWNDGR